MRATIWKSSSGARTDRVGRFVTSTNLPTEPGTYLFCGVRSAKDVSVTSLSIHTPRVELVRVHRGKDGKLSYVGVDFFYAPHEAVGSWLNLATEAQAIEDEAKAILLDAAAQKCVPEVMSPEWPTSTESAVDKLAGPFRDEVKAFARRVLDRAIELKVVVPDKTYKSPGWWRLPK